MNLHRNGPESNYLALFDMTLALAIGVAIFEFAVELLSVDMLVPADALIVAVAIWTIDACFAVVFLRGRLSGLTFFCMESLTVDPCRYDLQAES